MASLPPVNPQAPSRVEPRAVDKQNAPGGVPEAVRYMLLSWAVMIAGEFLHQILVVTAAVLDPAPLREQAKEQAKAAGEQASDAMLNVSVYGAIAVMALIQLAFILLLALALRAIKQQKSWAANARRLLQVFGVFFGVRVLTLFMLSPAATSLPVAFYAFDGIIQIILGVAGVMGIVYSADKASVEWTESNDRPKANRKEQ